jgi:hypothetical protein
VKVAPSLRARHLPRLQTEANRCLQLPAHLQTPIFPPSHTFATSIAAVLTTLHQRAHTRTHSHSQASRHRFAYSLGATHSFRGVTPFRLTTLTKTTILQSSNRIAYRSHHLTMANTSRLPIGERVTNGDEQMSNCIIASSNRYADLRPFCDSTYNSNRTRWGSILPWEFPQNATREVEEAFLRRFFTEVEIHMQGGAHGAGAGFRFLKQAWYSMALRNLYHGIPAIAEKWMDENVALLEDPTMRGHLCQPEVTPETFFRSHEIQFHTSKLLKFVVPVIQAQSKIRYEQSAERTSSTESQRPTTNATPASDGSEAEVRPAALAMPASVARPAAAPRKALPPKHVSVPTDPYAAPSSNYQGTKSRQFRDFTPSYSQHAQQINGRKRDSQNGSNSFNRPLGNGRRQSENHHHFNQSMHGGFNSGTPAIAAAVPGSMPAATPSTPFPLYSAPPGQPYHAQGFQTLGQQTLGPCPPPNGSVSQNMFNSTAFNNTPRQQFSQPRHFSNHSDNERFSNNRTRNMSFNEVSNTSGDARRTSFGSRGGGARGQYRGSRGRGGQIRTSFGHPSEEQPSIGQASSDFYSKSGHSHGKRHSSAYQENTWRSTSEHPQVENAQPHRVFSGPEQYPSFQDYQGTAGARMLPPFIFPHGSAVAHHGTQILHRPLQTDMTQNPPALPADCEVGRNYIGVDAVHVDELVVFNIPVDATESEVAKTFAHACDVEVAHVRFTTNAHILASDKMAIVRFWSHEVARRVLDLREVDLYGRPLRIEVPHRFIYPDRPDFVKPFIHTHRHQGAYGLPPRDVNLWLHEPANSSVQQPQHNVQMRASANFFQSNEAGYTSYPPSTPFHSAKGEQALSVVQSANVTPMNSGPNTPKKPQSKSTKKNKKNKNKTPLASGVDGVSAIALDKSTALETPVKPPKQKRQAHSSSVNNDLPLAPKQISSLDSLSASKDAKESKPLQSSEKSLDNDAAAASASSQPLYEASLKSQSKELVKDYSHKNPIATKDELATEPTGLPPRNPPTVEATRPSGGSPTIEPAHHQVCQSEVGSDITPKVSPRPQLPVQQHTESIPSPGHAVVPPQSSPPSSRGIRPASVDRRLSDSDHVDESFHTASGSPPDDKQTQAKDVAASTEQPARISQLIKPKPRPDSPISPVSSQSGKIMTPVTPKSSPKTEVSVSIQNPTSSNNKARSDIDSKDDKSHKSTPQRDVGDAVDTLKAVSADQKSDDIPPPSPATVVQRGIPAIPSLEHAPTRSDMPDSRSEEKVTDMANQSVVSSSSVPSADRNARKTSVPSQVSASPHSPGNSSSNSKAAAKKGPSQTESLSMFGKKQQKQKKSTKGKGTLKGKPQDSGSTSGLSDGISGRHRGGVATPTSTANASTTGKETASLSDISRLDNRTGGGSNSDESKSAVSRQESPGKGGILGSLGGLGRVGNFFSMASPPSVSGHETMPQDAKPDGALTYSKAPVALAPISSSTENNPVDNPGTASDLGSKHDYEKPSDTHDNGVSTSASIDSDIRGVRSKKRGRNKKSKNQNVEQKGDLNVGTEGNGEGELVSSNPVAGTLEDTMNESHDVDLENRSDDSSTTMGRPTPQASPKRLSESKRKRVENRLANTEQHILTPPAPRNRHIKRKSYSRSASSATGLSKQEATPPTPIHALSEIEHQPAGGLRVWELTNSEDDEDGSKQNRQRVIIFSRSGDNESSRVFPLTASDEGGRYDFIHLSQATGGDQVILGPELMESLRSTEAPVERVLEEVDSEDESSK